MENLELARLVLKIVETEPNSFDMTTYGQRIACGTVACLAGHAMLQSGYTLVCSARFERPDGSHVPSNSIEGIKLLGLSDSEVFNKEEWCSLFDGSQSNRAAIRRFRALIEAEETRRQATP